MNELNYEDLIFFDLETSGLDFNKHEIIQIAAIDARTGHEFMTRVDFDIDAADPHALENNSFDENLWNDTAISLTDAVMKFSDFIKEHSHLHRKSKNGRNIYTVAALAGFNILGFDKFFLAKAFDSEGIFLPADYRMFDVYQMCLWKYPGLKRYSLEAICEMMGVNAQFHDALEDVKATISIFKKIVQEPLVFEQQEWMK